MKCQNLFSGKNKKQIKMSSTEKFTWLAHRVIVKSATTVELQWLEHIWDHGKLFEL